MIRHIVLLKVKDETSREDIDHVFEMIGALKNEIPGILAFEAGVDSSPEGLGRGYTHGFMLDFIDSAARDAYLSHPEHLALQPALMRILEDKEDNVLVIDFESGDRSDGRQGS